MARCIYCRQEFKRTSVGMLGCGKCRKPEPEKRPDWKEQLQTMKDKKCLKKK